MVNHTGNESILILMCIRVSPKHLRLLGILVPYCMWEDGDLKTKYMGSRLYRLALRYFLVTESTFARKIL